MGFDRRFTLGLAAWTVALFAALMGLTEALRHAGFSVTRIVAALLVAGALAGIVRHVERTNLVVARFVEALRHRDLAVRFDERGGSGFGTLAASLNEALHDLGRERARNAEELRFWDALVDDLPVAVLTTDQVHGLRAFNKMGRQLCDELAGRGNDAGYGEPFAAMLMRGGPTAQEIVNLPLGGGVQRAIVRVSAVARLGIPGRIVTVAPAQAALDRVEVGAQADLIRVLTHEILNSLTPITSLAETAAALLVEEQPDLDEARLAILTLARRAEGTRRFVESYRSVARLPEPRRRRFAAKPFAEELARLFAVEWVGHRLTLDLEPDHVLDADPDLLAQALINLLRNAAQASDAADIPAVALSIRSGAGGGGTLMAVEDNGPGIARSMHGEVFLPFFTTRPQGSGIGLHLVRQIAVAHDWRIEIAEGSAGGALIRIVAE